jgi:hypothetical protein
LIMKGYAATVAGKALDHAIAVCWNCINLLKANLNE